MAHQTARGFNRVSAVLLIISIAAVALVSADVVVGLGLGFGPEDIPLGLLIVIGAAVIRYIGLWIMRATGGLD